MLDWSGTGQMKLLKSYDWWKIYIIIFDWLESILKDSYWSKKYSTNQISPIVFTSQEYKASQLERKTSSIESVCIESFY